MHQAQRGPLWPPVTLAVAARTSVSVLLCLAAGHCDCEKDAQSGSWDGNMANEPRRLIATATHQRDRLIIFLVVLVVLAALAVGWYYLSQ